MVSNDFPTFAHYNLGFLYPSSSLDVYRRTPDIYRADIYIRCVRG